MRLSELFAIPTVPRPRYHAIVVGTGLAAIGLIVDRIAGQREIVVKTITDPLIRVDGVSGATELGDGRARADSRRRGLEPRRGGSMRA